MSLLRSLLFVPGNKANMLEKALGFAPDVFIPDMEDSVPTAEKRNAREVIKSHLPRLAASGVPIIPRVNSLDTEWIEEDLAAVVGPHIYGISVGKVDVPDDIAAISDMIADLERRAGIESGTLKMIPWLESAKAIVHCYPICSSSPRIIGVAFGGEDFTHDMGIERLEDESEVAYPRNVLCVAARAAGIAALDTPYFRFKDEDGLKANIAASKQTGFKGKFAIHPAQIAAINAGFSPSEAEIAQARRVVAAFAEAERQGRGSTSLDGRVIDVPVVKRARAVLAAAGIEA
ncbi:MAG TPA: CoA ester lyase [Gammaproteobacteria bacterium]|nr:CoA ester lyase [Gammaproteobacteria bacterium]